MFALILKELERVLEVVVVDIKVDHQAEGNKRQEQNVPSDRAPTQLLLVQVFEDERQHDCQSGKSTACRQHAQNSADKPAPFPRVIERSYRQKEKDAFRVAHVQEISRREDGEVENGYLGRAPAVFLLG